MSQIPTELRYVATHEWARAEEDGTVTVGITDHAQDALGDVVYVEPPQVGSTVSQGDAFAEVESTKSVSDVYAPVSGTIVAVNEALEDTPELVNTDPYGDGWFAVIEATDLSELDALKDATTYEEGLE